jgi:hypothetical protein
VNRNQLHSAAFTVAAILACLAIVVMEGCDYRPSFAASFGVICVDKCAVSIHPEHGEVVPITPYDMTATQAARNADTLNGILGHRLDDASVIQKCIEASRRGETVILEACR